MAEEGADPDRCGPLQFLLGWATAVSGGAGIDFRPEVTMQPDRERQLNRLANRPVTDFLKDANSGHIADPKRGKCVAVQGVISK